LINSFLQIGGKEFLVNIERFILKKRLEFFGLRVEVSHCIVNSVLTHEFSWEAKSISSEAWKRNLIVHEVQVFLSPLLVVLDELVMEVSSWEIIG
jgi:hypothetical protein